MLHANREPNRGSASEELGLNRLTRNSRHRIPVLGAGAGKEIAVVERKVGDGVGSLARLVRCKGIFPGAGRRPGVCDVDGDGRIGSRVGSHIGATARGTRIAHLCGGRGGLRGAAGREQGKGEKREPREVLGHLHSCRYRAGGPIPARVERNPLQHSPRNCNPHSPLLAPPCSDGSTFTSAISPGAAPATPMPSGSPRSCSSRPA